MKKVEFNILFSPSFPLFFFFFSFFFFFFLFFSSFFLLSFRWASLLNGMIGVIGDLAEVENINVKPILERQSVMVVLQEAQRHESQKLRKLGEWGNRVVTQACSRQ